VRGLQRAATATHTFRVTSLLKTPIKHHTRPNPSSPQPSKRCRGVWGYEFVTAQPHCPAKRWVCWHCRCSSWNVISLSLRRHSLKDVLVHHTTAHNLTAMALQECCCVAMSVCGCWIACKDSVGHYCSCSEHAFDRQWCDSVAGLHDECQCNCTFYFHFLFFAFWLEWNVRM
jgi:hypothetical protein